MDRDREDPVAGYPVGEKQPDRVRTRTGRPLSALNLDELLAGRIDASEFRITPQVLRLQAKIAAAAGRPNLAENLRRGAELVEVPSDMLIELYELLRPGRATGAGELRNAAARLRRDYAAERTAALIEEAAEVYERRGLFRRRF